MPNQFYKGRTNNHLTWVMVDATDFATPESALSAATKIKIYGKLRGATGTNFVSSGTGSLTNDITHVGASATGIYTIALAKADLSDASAAWYDQYIISLSATGAAYQTLVVDGGIDLSAMSAYQSRLSDLASYLVAMSDVVSNAYSAAAQANSRILVVQSNVSEVQSVLVVMSGILSDVYSNLSDLKSDFQSRVPKAVATNSQLSDLHSDLKSYLTAMSDSISNVDSAVNSQYSDLASKIGAITVTIGASDLSEIVSQVVAGIAVSGPISDIYSLLSDLRSDFQSRVPKLVATNSQLSDLHSDLRSYLVVMSGVQSDIYSLCSNINSATVGSPDLSDIASAVLAEFSDTISNLLSAIAATNPTASDIASVVWTNTPGTAVASRVLQIRNQVSDLQSDFQSRVPKRVATDSQLSDLHSDLKSYLVVMSGIQSDIYSNLSDLKSDFQSRVPKLVATNSQLSDLHSDLKSAIGNVSVAISASDISDLASQVIAALPGAATASDIASVVWTNTPGAAAASRILQIRNQVSDLQSDFQSRVPKLVATNSQLSDLHSDLKSHLAISSGVQSDIYSLLSDLHSDVGVLGATVSDFASDFQSRVPKRVATDSQLSAMTSDLHSHITAGPLNVTMINGTSLIGDGAGTPWGPE